MSTMNISLSDALRSFVEEQVSRGGYGTSSEYVRELIRRDKERTYLRSLLVEGAASPITGEADAAYFASLRARASRAGFQALLTRRGPQSPQARYVTPAPTGMSSRHWITISTFPSRLPMASCAAWLTGGFVHWLRRFTPPITTTD